MNFKWKMKGKTVTKKLRDLWRKGTHKHMETYLIYFDNHRCLSLSEKSKCMWTHGKDGTTWARCAIFTMCLQIFTLFWLRKTSVVVEIYQISFRVFVCAFHPEISLFFGKNFPFFVLSILRYFPFHMICLMNFKINIKYGRWIEETVILISTVYNILF